MSRRIFRYSFIRFLCFVVLFFLLFLLYISSTKSKYFANVVNQRFYDIDVQQMIQGRLVEVIERDLIKEDDGEEDVDAELNYDLEIQDQDIGNKEEEEIADEPQLHVEVNSEIQVNVNEPIVVIEAEPLTSRLTIPKPTLSPEVLKLHKRLNLTNPGRWGAPVVLSNLAPDIERMLNASKEKYQINEFASNLVPLDRELPDIRTKYCQNKKYSDNLPMASVIMVFHNEALSMILRSVYSVLNRSPEHLLREIILVDDCSDIGKSFNL